MPLDDNDKDLLRLLIAEGVSAGFDKHREKDHEPLTERLDETRRHVWLGGGILLTLSTLMHKLWP